MRRAFRGTVIHERSARGARRARAAGPASLLLAIAIAGCGGRPFAEGGSRELTLITSFPPDAPEVLLLRAIVERPALRFEDERAYTVHLASPDDAHAYRATNVIVAGHGSGEGIPPPARRLRELLGAEGRPFAFVTDLWRRGQAAGIVWTRTREEWIPALARTQNRFFLELDRATFAAVRERVQALPRNAGAERRLVESLGVRMRVPRGYDVRVDPEARAALLLDTGPPARMLRIRILPSGRAPAGDAKVARAALARVFRPHERTLDEIEPTLVPDEMAGAVRQVHGLWEDERVSAAGPFRFYEVVRGSRRYEIDLAVFAPGRPKLPHLRELQAIAETISTP